MKKFVFLLLAAITVIFSSCSREPDVEKIKADLIGQRLEMGGLSSWRFDSMSEFEDFEILSTLKNEYLLEYKVRLKLGDTNGKTYAGEARTVYRKESGKWKFSLINRIRSR